VSLAPKISIEQLSSKLNTDQIVRMIPNATSYINEGYNPLTFASGFHPDAKSELLSILNVLGQTFEVAESKLEGYALISAMLPTYFWFQWNELEKLGIQMGLSAEESKFAVRDTLLAAIHLLYDSGLESDQVNNLIPVKPIGESEGQIREILQTRLMGLFQKIQPI